MKPSPRASLPVARLSNESSAKLRAQETINFWLTNRIPRVLATRVMGRLSKIRHPWFAKPALAVWRRLADLRLYEAEQTTFASLHDCFVRRLKPGLRPYDPSPNLMCSPCDAIVGAKGTIESGSLLQVKGMAYKVQDLLHSPTHAKRCEGWQYLTLRLTSSMYHHFHAPHDVTVKRLRYIHGDVWNVNPPTLKRINSLFAKNERAVIELELHPTGQTLWLIPVAAVLVASMRFTFSDIHLHLDYQGPTEVVLNTHMTKGQEMGWFEHGSTIICLVPPGWNYIGPHEGEIVRAGTPLWENT
ncbi:MAG: archaetidylserine decarboxylase [Burkholderiaceae bacterium]|nr:archaetidylserine decarboxylase [Burkholderiaceae bacterium]MCD8515779.1 archaetidylserine decarboxylase [Burkholderiaceae bacterium]MCD8537031.1 archaetidylserine decarboxylase [Burkholderiaceae bacterium]MCD8565471.1 archaetidylserine decarboxylase [Burkholderiaceae bacterium]